METRSELFLTGTCCYLLRLILIFVLLCTVAAVNDEQPRANEKDKNGLFLGLTLNDAHAQLQKEPRKNDEVMTRKTVPFTCRWCGRHNDDAPADDGDGGEASLVSNNNRQHLSGGYVPIGR